MISLTHKWATPTFLKKAQPTLSFIFCLLLILPTTNLWAAKYCLSKATPTIKSSVESKLGSFLKSSEHIIWEGSCFELPLSSGRDMLFQKLIGEVTTFNIASEVVVTRSACELELIEESKGKSSSDRIGVGAGVELGKSESDYAGQTTSRLLLSSGRPGRIQAYETTLEVVCTLIGQAGQAEVEVWLVGNRGRAIISNTLSLSRGQRQFLGDVVQTLQESNKDFSLSQGARRVRTTTNRKTDFYLLLK